MREHALDLHSPRFDSILRRLERIKPTLVFGVIEQDGQKYFNTAVVVTRG